jgi:hypothetical protein
MTRRLLSAALVVAGATVVAADEGMWRFDQLPTGAVKSQHGVTLTASDLERLQRAPVRILGGDGAGTGTFASANGLILTNHHVALDCIRTSTLAEQAKNGAENLIESGFTAKSPADELVCKRFRAQVERSAQDVTAAMDAAVVPGMDIAAVQRARQAVRLELERGCQKERGQNFSCSVVDFNSGARTLLIAYEEFKDIRLVYAPEKQLGYFGGDEMNFRFPRYVADISILRAYQGTDGSHAEFDPAHVPVRPDSYRLIAMEEVREGDFTLVAGFPGNTNRYRESLSASYNLRKGIPDQIRSLEEELQILRRHAAADPRIQVILQSRIFGLANSLKYEQDLLAALKASDVVAGRQRRERDFMRFLDTRPDLKRLYGDVIDAQAAVYANDVEARADLDAALSWIQKSSVVSYASALREFAAARAQASDRDRDPQFQERNWPQVRESLLDDEPLVPALEEDLLTEGFTRALRLTGDQAIPAVQRLVERLARGGASPNPRDLARAVLAESSLSSAAGRKPLLDAPLATFESSTEPAIVFAGDLAGSLSDLRARVRILNEKILGNRSRFARGLQAWRGETMYPDANLTLRVSAGKVSGLVASKGGRVPFATRFGDLFALAERRGNKGDFALPPRLLAWRQTIGDAEFKSKYANMIVDFISTNDITGGNSGSSTLNRRLEIVGLIFDGNEESIASDWVYNGAAGRALSTSLRFALTIAREVHGAGWIVDELLNPARPLSSKAAALQSDDLVRPLFR